MKRGKNRFFSCLSISLFNTRIAEVGVAFQHCNFFLNLKKNIFGKKFEKKIFHLFYSNFFNIISEKKVKIYFFQIFLKNVF